MTAQQLADMCRQGADLDTGRGAASINASAAIVNESGVIDTPCTVTIGDGAVVYIEKSQLTTADLTFDVPSGADSGRTVVIDNSTLTGKSGAGLIIRLRGDSDLLVVTGSGLNYPQTVQAGAQASVALVNVTLSSNSGDGSSQGILIASGAGAVFNAVTASTDSSSQSRQALLVAEYCTFIAVTGTTGSCHFGSNGSPATLVTPSPTP